MRNRLPDFILNRPKVGFPSDMSDWLIGQNIESILRTMLSDNAGFSANHLNMDFVKKICERHFGEIRTIREKRFDMILWYLFSAEMWFMAFNNRDGKLSQLLEQQYGINVTAY